MAYASSAVTVGGTAVRLLVQGHRKGVTVFNNHASNILYLGGSNVTTANGFPILAQTGRSFNEETWDELWGVASAAATDVRLMVESGPGD